MPNIRVKNINSIMPLSVKFARFSFNGSSESRLRIYHKLASLLRNNFSLSDALERIWMIESYDGKKVEEAPAVALSAWIYELQKGKSFADAISGWVPERERMMLMAGDMSRLEVSLVNLIRVSEGYKRILEPLKSALAYPSFLILLTFLLLIMIGLKMVPPMAEFFEGKEVGGMAGSLIDLSEFMLHYWFYIPPAVIAVFVLMGLSLKYLTGPIRKVLDKAPPWSLYRMFSGVSLLLSLSALVKAGVPIVKGVQMIRKDSTIYLTERLDLTLAYMRNGSNLGQALNRTGFEFPTREIIGDLSIYSELDNFQEALEKIANEFLEDSIKLIKAQAGILNGIALMFIFAVVAWVLFGIFDISNQIQNTF